MSRLFSVLSVVCRLILGAVFIYASVHKIADPPAFAKIIWGYKILPGSMVNGVAVFLPWLELLAGVALILGLWLRGSAFVTGGMLVVFLVAIGFNLYRGIDFDCGCFSHEVSETQSFLEGLPVFGPAYRFLFTSPESWTTFWRDCVLLFMAAVVFFKPVGWRKAPQPVQSRRIQKATA